MLYNLLEESSQISVFDWNPEVGSLAPMQTVSTLPLGFAGSNLAAEILVSPDGRFVYASNRLHNSIAAFSAAADGTLRPISHEWVRGTTRAISPSTPPDNSSSPATSAATT